MDGRKIIALMVVLLCGMTSCSSDDDGSTTDIYTQVYTPAIDEVCSRYSNLYEENRWGYIFITDLHFNPNKSSNTKALLRQLNAVVEIANRLQIDFVCIGGDIIDGTDDKNYIHSVSQQISNILSGCTQPVAWISGNHDDNSYSASQMSEKEEITRHWFVDNMKNVPSPVFGSPDSEDTYYYFDLPNRNLRVVCLDFIDFPKGKKGRSWWGLSKTQVAWVCETAFDTNQDIVILCHGQLVDKKYDFYQLGDQEGTSTDMKNAILAFNGKTSVTLYGKTYDYSGRQGSIVLSHHGHWHSNMVLSIGSMPCILTGCAKNALPSSKYQPVDGKTDTFIIPDQETATLVHSNGYGYEFYYPSDRTFGTLNEAQFDVVSVNTTQVNCLRFGAGEDRIISR